MCFCLLASARGKTTPRRPIGRTRYCASTSQNDEMVYKPKECTVRVCGSPPSWVPHQERMKTQDSGGGMISALKRKVERRDSMLHVYCTERISPSTRLASTPQNSTSIGLKAHPSPSQLSSAPVTARRKALSERQGLVIAGEHVDVIDVLWSPTIRPTCLTTQPDHRMRCANDFPRPSKSPATPRVYAARFDLLRIHLPYL